MGSAKKKSNAKGISTKRAKKRARPTTRFAICIDNSEYPASLERRKVYRVLPDADAAKDGDLRIIDESGEDYLYPAKWFAVVPLPPKVRALMQSTQ